MNFQHTVHIGSGDLEIENSHLDALQGQMQSKGGYGKAYIVKVIKRNRFVKMRILIYCLFPRMENLILDDGASDTRLDRGWVERRMIG